MFLFSLSFCFVIFSASGNISYEEKINKEMYGLRQTDREREREREREEEESEGMRYMTIMSGEIVRILLYVSQHEDRGGVEVLYLTFLAYIFGGYE
jgi:hypothetical protein